jgi:hypothetical protein
LALFSAIQVETGVPLGPPDGRYVVRPAPGEPPSHVLVFKGPQVTVVFTSEQLTDERAAASWLKQAGEDALEEGLTVLGKAMYAFRLVVADPHVSSPGRRQLAAARVGWGEGEPLSEGRFSETRDLPPPREPRFPRRSKVLEPQARMAAALSGREPTLVCAELALRASFDLEQGRAREAALGAMVALNAAVTELSLDAKAEALIVRTRELRELLPGVIAAAQTALSGPLSVEELEAVSHALARIEAALRARAVVSA